MRSPSELCRSCGWTKSTSVQNTRLMLHVNHTVPDHAHIREVNSSYVKFVISVRSYFMMQFKKYQKGFPGVDGEALFIGTVFQMNSIDHAQLV